jgi:RNA 2',3'-cyclic 3'-phosphodiesterase
VNPSSLPDRLRAFVALRLDAAVDSAIAEMTQQLQSSNDGVRWVRPSNFHLTLFFLGPAVPHERIAPVAGALEAIAADTLPFDVEARGTGAFPSLARPRVIWVGLHSPDLMRLATRVIEAAARCGFKSERPDYSPHLTIGRVRSLRSRGALRRALEHETHRSFGVSRIERVLIYRSELGSEASTYHEVAAFPFGAERVRFRPQTSREN